MRATNRLLLTFSPLFTVWAWVLLTTLPWGHLALAHAGEARPEDSSFEGKAAYLFAEFHEHEGCPTNSICDQETGIFRKKYLVFTHDLAKKGGPRTVQALETFRQKNGLPIGHWIHEALKSKSNSFAPISWDSPCHHHRQLPAEDAKAKTSKRPPAPALIKFQLGESFIKDTKGGKIQLVQKGRSLALPLEGGPLLLDPILLSADEGKKTVPGTLYYVPQGEFPLYVENQRLHLVRDAEGVYYSLLISPQGEWKVVPPPAKGELPQIVDCPEQLITYFQKGPNREGVYSGQSCRTVIDRRSRNKYIMLVPWSC